MSIVELEDGSRSVVVFFQVGGSEPGDQYQRRIVRQVLLEDSRKRFVQESREVSRRYENFGRASYARAARGFGKEA